MSDEQDPLFAIAMMFGADVMRVRELYTYCRRQFPKDPEQWLRLTGEAIKREQQQEALNVARESVGLRRV